MSKKKDRGSPTPQPHLDTAQLSTVSLEPSGVRAGAWKPHGHGKQKARFQDSPHDLNLAAIQSDKGLRPLLWRQRRGLLLMFWETKDDRRQMHFQGNTHCRSAPSLLPPGSMIASPRRTTTIQNRCPRSGCREAIMYSLICSVYTKTEPNFSVHRRLGFHYC